MLSEILNRLPWKWYALAFVVVVLDLLTKSMASESLEYGRPLVFTSFFNFTLSHNYGAAFSFLAQAGGWQVWFLSGLAALVSIGLIVWVALLKKEQWMEILALSLILGGAIGNLYDRVTLGYVVDFIVVHYKDNYFPAFNIADSAITLGAGILIYDAIFNSSSKQDDESSINTSDAESK